jgi:sugar fermentation stimulation protein A
VEDFLGREIGLPVEIVEVGRFVERPNRFIGVVEVKGELKRAHISDTGRLRELLKPGVKSYLARNPNGKLDFKLVGVETPIGPILLYPPAHNWIGERLIEMGLLGFSPGRIERERSVGESRLDLLVDRQVWVEIKGCNLQIGEWCLFPDAPTTRGARHLRELGEVKGVLLLLLFRPCLHWGVRWEEDPKFGEVLEQVKRKGVQIFPVGLETYLSPTPRVKITHFPGVEFRKGRFTGNLHNFRPPTL